MLTMINDRTTRGEDEFTMTGLAGANEDLMLSSQELYHNHLPKLADAGYIKWDRKNDVIRRGPRLAAIAPLISLMQRHADELPGDWP